MADDWKCAGCGIVSPGKIRICDCATGCVFKYENGKMVNELKIEHYNSVADHCHAVIAKLYEKPRRPCLAAEDINLIKAALVAHAR